MNRLFLSLNKEEHPDGRIDIDEFARLYKGVIQPKDESNTFSRALFELFDNEKSGKITLSDFLVLTPFEIRHDRSIDGRAANYDDDEDKENVDATRKIQQRLIDDVDERTLELALDVFNRRAEKIDKEELLKVPYVLCEASGGDARKIFESDEMFAKKKAFVFENDKLDKDEFARLVRGCRRFII